MDTNNMKHLDYIRAVAEEDLRYVNIKDRQYGGSWKRRGGVGAFMMLARKWDRLENMLSGAYKFDIFEGIQDLGGDTEKQGADGTILAEVRDLRRYLMLVEAEMMARGVVLDQYGVPVISEGKIYERGRAPRWLVRDKMNDVLDVGDPVTAAMHDLVTGVEIKEAIVISLRENNTATIKFKDGSQYTARGDQLRHDATRERVAVTNTPHFEGPKVSGAMKEAVESHASMPQRTPEDGAQHASLGPWVVSPGYALRKDIDDELFNRFWQRRAPEIYVLEPHVVSHNAPRTLCDFYTLRGDHWVIRLEKCPADARDYYPKLTRELNMKEHNDLPEWQRPLYTWDDKGMKFVLAEINGAWAGDEA